MSQSRIDELRMIDPVLTTVAQGYTNTNMVAEALFPTIQVSKLKGKIPVFGKEAFLIRDTYRAIKAQSNRIPPSDIDFITFETKERDIEISLDYIEEEESPDFSRYEQRITKELVDILQLGREKEAADLVQNPNNFNEELIYEVNANQAFDDYTKNADPILIIRNSAAKLRSLIARYPNTMVIGDKCYQALINHPKLLERVKYAGISKVSRNILSELTDIPNVFVGSAVFSNDGINFSDVWLDNIILAYVDRSDRQLRSEYNPSFGYTLQREGKPEIDTYYENGGKIKVIRNTDNYAIQITAKDAGFLIYNTNHIY
ncbi:MAG: hypothetical protein N2319_07490 [Candidatus Kapabacteria bacterium]|nr:hypothetical protein [Candidatus Kapabacteria bacterium]